MIVFFNGRDIRSLPELSCAYRISKPLSNHANAIHALKKKYTEQNVNYYQLSDKSETRHSWNLWSVSPKRSYLYSDLVWISSFVQIGQHWKKKIGGHFKNRVLLQLDLCPNNSARSNTNGQVFLQTNSLYRWNKRKHVQDNKNNKKKRDKNNKSSKELCLRDLRNKNTATDRMENNLHLQIP